MGLDSFPIGTAFIASRTCSRRLRLAHMRSRQRRQAEVHSSWV